jgi:hypothetical protein
MPEEDKKQFVFFVDAKEFKTDRQSLTGADIKRIAGVPDAYQLFEEVAGDQPDRAISDADSVDLAPHVRHFFAVPPATFGAK